MDFEQIDLSYTIATLSDEDSDIDDLIDNVFIAMDHSPSTQTIEGPSHTNKVATNTLSSNQSVSFFGAVQPIHSQQNSSSQPIFEYIAYKLKDKDDNNDGYLDFEEFREAITELDEDISTGDIAEIFDSVLSTDLVELSICTFLQHIQYPSTVCVTPKAAFRAAFPIILAEVWGQ
eukprot:37584_1